jgi:hypothetical protein
MIPIYINLKELERSDDASIDREFIESFVLRALNRVNDRDIEEFLDQEFNHGLEKGTWFFLFDSFDEIPEVLSSVEADAVIRRYGDAISDFLAGMNQCRGVIASRLFRGPGQFGLPRFRILSLSESRQVQLIRKADLNPQTEGMLIGQLAAANDEIRSAASNPMFLALLCEHMKGGKPFPENAYTVFENYISSRLNRDEDRLRRRFNLSSQQLRQVAEHVAFTMVADTGLGLSPSRGSIQSALVHLELGAPPSLDTYLDALEYIKLARSEVLAVAGMSKSFTFAHRRFQEYFATRVVLREPERVRPRQLLTDARWRETSVVMCQTQPSQVLHPILVEVQSLLSEMANESRIVWSYEKVCEILSSEADEGRDKGSTRPESRVVSFPWPVGALHLLGIIQEGFGRRLSELPEQIRRDAARILFTAYNSGIIADQKWSLEVAATVPQPVQLYMLRDAFASRSQWLRSVAYRQAPLLGAIPHDVATRIRLTLMGLAQSGSLRKERHAVQAHILTLNEASQFLSVLRLFLWIPVVDAALCLLLYLTVLPVYTRSPSWGSLSFTYITLLLAGGYFGLHFLPRYRHVLEPFLPFMSLSSRRWRKLVFWGTDLLTLGSVYARVGVALVALDGLEVYFDTAPARRLLGFLLLYILLWAPFAQVAVGMGRLTGLRWSLLLPLFPVLILLSEHKQAWKWLRNTMRPRIILEHIAVFAGVALGMSLILGPMYLLITWLDWGPWVILSAMGTVTVVAALYRLYNIIRNRIVLRRWLSPHRSRVTIGELLDGLESFSGATRGRFAAQVLSEVRRSGTLIASQEAMSALGQLAMTIERLRRGERSPMKPVSGSGVTDPAKEEQFDRWLEKYYQNDLAWIIHERPGRAASRAQRAWPGWLLASRRRTRVAHW